MKHPLVEPELLGAGQRLHEHLDVLGRAELVHVPGHEEIVGPEFFHDAGPDAVALLDKLVERLVVLNIRHVHVDAPEIRLGLVENNVRGSHVRHLADHGAHPVVVGADLDSPAASHAHPEKTDLRAVDLAPLAEEIDHPAGGAGVVVLVHPDLVHVALALPRAVHDANIHPTRMKNIVPGVQAVLLDHVHARNDEHGGLGVLARRRIVDKIGFLVGLELGLVPGDLPAVELAHLVVAAPHPAVILDFLRMPVHRDEVLRAAIAKRRTVEVVNRGDLAAGGEGVVRLFLLDGRLARPRLGERAPARHPAVHRL